MVFSSLPFLLGFLPLVLCGSVLIGRCGPFAAEWWLIGCSLLFYGIGARDDLPLLIASVGGNFLLLKLACRSARRNRLIGLGMVLDLCVLGWFKYCAPGPATPLGISFFTFTQIGGLLYYADGEAPAPAFRRFALFAAFFPSLLAGPILSARDTMPQLAGPLLGRPTRHSLAVGLGFFLIGLLKKTLLADPLAVVVGHGFADASSLALFSAWQTALSYSLQLYFDFSGYSDMAIGLARMFGLHYPDNFDRPYRARSVIDYWQRWHMTLTRFVMAYVHAPLTLAVLRHRRRRGLPIDQAGQRSLRGFAGMIALPIGSTMLLVAVWHGASWTFLLFGLLHTAFLLINHAWRLFRAPRIHPAAATMLTYLGVLAASVVFRAASVKQAMVVLAAMAGAGGVEAVAPDLRSVLAVLWLVGLYAIVWFAPTTRSIMQDAPAWRFGFRQDRAWGMVMGGAATLGMLAAGGTGEFLYFRF